MIWKTALLLGAMLLLAQLAGAARAETTTTAISPKSVAAIPSPAECDELGRQLAGDFNVGKFDAFFGRMDKPAYIALVFDGFELPESERARFEKDFTKSTVETLTAKFQQFSTAKYLRTLDADGQKRVLLRLTASNGGVTYVAFVVTKNEAGAVVWCDAFGYATAELMSDGLRRFLLTVSQGKLTRPRNVPEAALLSNGRQFVQRITRMQKFFERGDIENGVRVIEQLPDELRTAKFVLSQRLQAAQGRDEDQYLRAIDAWEEAHPGDPSLNLIAIDGHMLRKAYPAVVRCVTALENQLKGMDGRLCFVKACALEQDRMPREAKAAAEAGVKVEPDMPENYSLLLKLALDEGDFSEAIRVLKSIEKSMPDSDPKRMIPEARTTDEFAKSDEFRTWMRARMGGE